MLVGAVYCLLPVLWVMALPLAYAVLVTDSGSTEIPLDKTPAFGRETFTWNHDLSRAKWARISWYFWLHNPRAA